MQKILIIGKGYIGNSLAKLFQRRNIIHEHIARSDVDYSNSDVLFNYLRDRSIAAVVNCAGYTGRPNVDAAEKEKVKRLHKLAQDFFEKSLANSPEAQKYLRENRKLDEEMIKQFDIITNSLKGIQGQRDHKRDEFEGASLKVFQVLRERFKEYEEDLITDPKHTPSLEMPSLEVKKDA